MSERVFPERREESPWMWVTHPSAGVLDWIKRRESNPRIHSLSPTAFTMWPAASTAIMSFLQRWAVPSAVTVVTGQVPDTKCWRQHGARTLTVLRKPLLLDHWALSSRRQGLQLLCARSSPAVPPTVVGCSYLLCFLSSELWPLFKCHWTHAKDVLDNGSLFSCVYFEK